jgi:nucleoid DNA-binding protein
MNKPDFMKKVKEALELSNVDKADEIVSKLSKLVVELVKSGEEVSFGDLGKFSLKENAARKGRNPHTGETIDIPAKRSMKFKLVKKTKDMLNQ